MKEPIIDSNFDQISYILPRKLQNLLSIYTSNTSVVTRLKKLASDEKIKEELDKIFSKYYGKNVTIKSENIWPVKWNTQTWKLSWLFNWITFYDNAYWSIVLIDKNGEKSIIWLEDIANWLQIKVLSESVKVTEAKSSVKAKSNKIIWGWISSWNWTIK